MLKIGLTGGIGSGKTVASDAFQALGITVIDTDIIAREVLTTNHNLLKQLAAAFGGDILDTDNKLIRHKLRDIAFSNAANKQTLDNIMHPAIRQATLDKIKETEHQQEHYCIIVVPLLIETGFIELVDRVLVVTAPLERKLEWLEKRSQLNPSEAQKIMSTQTTDKEKIAAADDVICNDKDIHDVQTTVAELHKKYLQLSSD